MGLLTVLASDHRLSLLGRISRKGQHTISISSLTLSLVERATQGDAAALDHLVTEHWRFVYTMCLSHVGHTADAEDLTQEVFIQMSHDVAGLREPDKFLPWLRQVARNVCRMWQRRQRPASESLDTGLQSTR
jgi:RNA polymerase sigma-70 factor (ECF subfamily)